MPERTLVMKFGGTSVGTPQAMEQATAIVAEARRDWPRLVVVTSALSGVTNLLLDSAYRAAGGDGETFRRVAVQLLSNHTAIAEALVQDTETKAELYRQIEELVDSFSDFCQAISVLGEATPRALDTVAALGERMSVRLLAASLESAGVKARFIEAGHLIITDDCFMAAHPDMEATAQRTCGTLEPLFKENIVPVVTGFIGATPQGLTTTLGRGGSDYSAAILGVVLSADDVWIWTDVDGVMTTDPRLVPQARTIPALSYREVAELAYYGARVLHPKTIRPVIEAGIGLRVANTFNPDHPGTRILADSSMPGNGQIKAVSAIRGQSLVTIEGRGMLGVPGVAARAFSAVAATGTSVPLISQASSEQSICFAVPVDAASSVIRALEDVFAAELARRDIDRIHASPETVIVTVVGAGMRHTPGIAGQIFSALGDKDVNVIAIAQGSSEVSISLVVDAADSEAAVRALHGLIKV